MNNETKTFGDVARNLARNPLGIIALFIVLAYGFAALVTAFAGELTAAERLPLVYFLVIFPALVLGVFSWLVSRHSNRLFAPSDFRDEDNYVKTLSATASLAFASAKSRTLASSGDENTAPTLDVSAIVEAVKEASDPGHRHEAAGYWRKKVLWVDDRPSNNVHERRAFEAMGLSFNLALTTEEALQTIEQQRFAVVISDMARHEGPREGYRLLDAMRNEGNGTPFFVYASSRSPEHIQETLQHKGQGCTNDPQELFQMVMRSVLNQ